MFQTICQMHICACGIIRLVNSMLNCLHNNFTGVNANADLQIGVSKSFYSVLHGQCSEASTDRMILMRLRGAKQRHDPITLRFVHDAIVTDDCFVHEI